MLIKEITPELLNKGLDEILKKYDLYDAYGNVDFSSSGWDFSSEDNADTEITEDDILMIIEEEVLETFKDTPGMKEKIKEVKRKGRKEKLDRIKNGKN